MCTVQKYEIVFMGNVPVMKVNQCQIEPKVESSMAYFSFGIFTVQEKLYSPGWGEFTKDNAMSPVSHFHLDRKSCTGFVY